MRLIRAFIIAWGATLLFTGTPSQAQNTDYGGADAGVLAYSAGSVAIPMNFTFRYRGLTLSPGSNRIWTGTIGCGCVGVFGARTDFDYTGRENGKVMARRLPPGDYKIYDFGFGGTIGNTITNYSTGQPYAIRFTIRPGETTYIGNFARAPSLGTSLEPRLGAKGYFIVSDQGDRDLPILIRKFTTMPPAIRAVVDVSGLGHPGLRSSAP